MSDIVVLWHPYDRHEVPLTRHRVHLRNAVDAGEHVSRLWNHRRLDANQDDGRDHARSELIESRHAIRERWYVQQPQAGNLALTIDVEQQVATDANGARLTSFAEPKV